MNISILRTPDAWWVQPLEETNIVTLDIEHPSTAYPWLRVAQETGAEVRLARNRCRVGPRGWLFPF
jgi:selenocysteine lyase/cysteine desulfurase